jgi:nucleoside-diphosphate-sugar epimerase
MIEGKVPVCPPFGSGCVDVRDVADLHLRAMTDPAAAGERFLAISGHSLRVVEVARILRARLGDRAAKVPTHVLELDHATDLGAIQAKGRQAAGNTEFNAADFWRDAVNLDMVVASLEATGLARRRVRLHPFANYKERDH